MPKDARFGLILGVGLVILIAVLYFRKDTEPTAIPPASSAAAGKAAAARPQNPGSAKRGQRKTAATDPPRNNTRPDNAKKQETPTLFSLDQE